MIFILKQVGRVMLEQKYLMVYQENNMVMPITMLSAGYQSLLWIIMNLAYRWALLNPDITENVTEATGIVLIDEIDMLTYSLF